MKNQLTLLTVVFISIMSSAQTTAKLKEEVWHMEEQYWDYVEKNDTISYKTLWHDDFVGYPSFGDGVSGKAGIAVWIPELHKDKNLKYSWGVL